jgi:FkbM family methyltransferase
VWALMQDEAISELKFVEVDVRKVRMRLAAFNRSLELCARMNYETEVLDFIDTIPPDGVFFDIGACEGRFSVYAGKNNVRTVSIEPEHLNFQVLVRNLCENGLFATGLVDARMNAVGDLNQTGILDIGQNWPGGHQKVVRSGDRRADLDFPLQSQQSVSIATLDHLTHKAGLPFPTHLKVDIDGSEAAFVAGARQTLANPKLRAVIIELLSTDPLFRTIVDAFRECGFELNGQYPIPNNADLSNFVFVRSH